ncbi:DUF6602 domain-containing protein [Acidiluteibacter ferrifornacis]|uniref:DUF6602 domain-containing protein n=1 Tax=Acidiluteibacter ferrifornacis TaxID=2692424 RepID=A0A6N9NIN0_9FLAO|nr:DUF6602 domain-containing protein [Acidiluteibacter ferrifornacis]NBG64525.1 hypothetical protein [Acidiluteibacter ferrifornacis]
MTKTPTLKEIFYNLQNQMIQKLSTDRKIIFHSPTKGGATELNWIDWLKKYLPNRYQVDQAFIVDSNGRFSEQMDLVIYDQQYSPFVFNQDGAIFIPAESVYAVFEIKQDLDKANFEYASDKIKSVRLLNRTSAPIVLASGRIDNPKKPFQILGGILTLTTTWQDVFGEPFQKAISETDKISRIDMGCCLEKGSFLIKYESDTYSFETSSDDESLIYFFLKLLSKLQELGTVPALDINAYGRALDSI